MSDEQSRKEFEKWFFQDESLRMYMRYNKEKDEYEEGDLQFAYVSWKACWKLCGGVKDD